MLFKFKFITLIFIGVIVSGLLGMGYVKAANAGLDSALNACKNVTMRQRQLAKAAGYDVDALCSAASEVQVKPEVSTPIVVNPVVTADEPADEELEEIIAEANDAPTLAEDKEAKVVEQKLEQFGYDLFAGSPTTFAPATEIPVQSNYVIGPGDSIQIQLFGKISANYTLTVSRNGVVQFPDLGPISLAGLTYVEMKALLVERVQKQMIGVQASISMGELRSIRIFMLGDASRPGSYTISSLSSMTNALFVSGGVRKVGSLRNIQLKRQGKVVSSLDLYDLLLKGDTSNDVRLLPGDVIFIPPIGKTAGIAGEVKRPAIYELKNEHSVKDLVQLAGGYLPSSYPKASRLERINRDGDRTLIDVDLDSSKGAKISLVNGDVLQIYSVLEKMEDIVFLEGHVYRPGGFGYRKGMKLTDLLNSIDTMLPSPDLDFAILLREVEPTRELVVKSVNLRAIFNDPSSATNILLQSRDKLIIFAANKTRDVILTPIIERLVDQERQSKPAKIVTILGAVRFKGTYPLTKGMTIQDLISAGGGMTTTPDLDYALLVREVQPSKEVSVQNINIKAVINDFSSIANIRLQARDRLIIFNANQSRIEELWLVLEQLKKQEKLAEPVKIVDVTGAIRFPGEYPLTENMSVKELILAGGGLKESTYISEAEITRKDYKNPEEASVKHFSISLKDVFSSNNMNAVLLHPLDHLNLKLIPRYQEKLTITLKGEVKFPGVYEFTRGDSLADIVSRAGGLTDLAHIEAAYFTRTDLKRKEAEQLADLQERLRADIAATQLEDTKNEKYTDVATLNTLLDNLKNSEATGRLVIDLSAITNGQVEDLQLRDGDQLIVPTYRQEITIIGEVQNPTSHIFNPVDDYRDYIDLSGGTTEKADNSRIYIIKANGSVFLPEKSGWFHDEITIAPGDTIVVPVEVDKVDNMTFWTGVSQIIYQMALGIRVINGV